MSIHWGRILVGGLLAEVALILAIVPLGMRLGKTFLHYTAPPGSFVTCFLAALWVARRIQSRFILHGTLVGVVAALIYVGLTRATGTCGVHRGPRAEIGWWRLRWLRCRTSASDADLKRKPPPESGGVAESFLEEYQPSI